MVNTNWEGASEVQSNWFKFEKVGDGIKGTLLSRRQQAGSPPFPDQTIYEIRTEDGVYNVGISVKKEGTIQRLNNCKVGEVIGILFEKEIPATTKGFAATKQLKILTWGMDPNFNAFSGGEEVASLDQELPPM